MNKFYVYQIMDGEIPVYIGKGSGKRLRNQQRAFKLPGKIIKEFAKEDDAFGFERQMIAEYNPIFNRRSGGNGGRVKVRKKPRLTACEQLCQKIGTRAYAARVLWSFRKSLTERFGYSVEQMNRFREIAYPLEMKEGV